MSGPQPLPHPCLKVLLLVCLWVPASNREGIWTKQHPTDWNNYKRHVKQKKSELNPKRRDFQASKNRKDTSNEGYDTQRQLENVRSYEAGKPVWAGAGSLCSVCGYEAPWGSVDLLGEARDLLLFMHPPPMMMGEDICFPLVAPPFLWLPLGSPIPLL